MNPRTRELPHLACPDALRRSGRRGGSDPDADTDWRADRLRVRRCNCGTVSPHITFLRFAHPDELKVQDMLLSKAAAQYQSTSFTLKTAEGAFAVQQFCPHMGEKLSQGCYDAARGVLVCPRHGWTFAVPGGGCQNARARLRIEPIQADIAARQPGGEAAG